MADTCGIEELRGFKIKSELKKLYVNKSQTVAMAYTGGAINDDECERLTNIFITSITQQEHTNKILIEHMLNLFKRMENGKAVLRTNTVIYMTKTQAIVFENGIKGSFLQPDEAHCYGSGAIHARCYYLVKQTVKGMFEFCSSLSETVTPVFITAKQSQLKPIK